MAHRPTADAAGARVPDARVAGAAAAPRRRWIAHLAEAADTADSIDWAPLLWAAVLAASLAAACFSVRAADAGTLDAPPPAALVTRDKVALRAAPSDGAPAQALLWRGEAVELRGARGDYVQVWDHHRERGGYVRATQLLRVSADPDEAPQLLALLAFVSEQPGAEPLGLALAAASIQALPAAALNGPVGAAVLDAVGRQAERLAERASAGSAGDVLLGAHLDVARRHGVQLRSREQGGRMVVCYDGDVYHRLLALPAASAEQKARAALGLTRADCLETPARGAEREAQDEALADLLARAEVPTSANVPTLAPHWRARLATRQAEVWSRIAFARAQRGDAAQARAAAANALQAIGRVDKGELVDADLAQFHAAAVRVNAGRWAAAMPAATPGAASAARLGIATQRAEDGQTCVSLKDLRQSDAAEPLAQRCTWGLVWSASAAPNRQGTALALAVQPLEGWRELWVFRRDAAGWAVQVLPPAALEPGIGYAEFAGWEPAGRRLLVAREALAQGRSIRRFEVVALDTLVAERTAFSADALGAFARWSDPAWQRDSLARR